MLSFDNINDEFNFILLNKYYLYLLLSIDTITGDESYPLYIKEKEEILSSLHRRAELLSHALNNLEGVHCNAIDGALYAFPTIILPGM
jgi:alanine transaminase